MLENTSFEDIGLKLLYNKSFINVNNSSTARNKMVEWW